MCLIAKKRMAVIAMIIFMIAISGIPVYAEELSVSKTNSVDEEFFPLERDGKTYYIYYSGVRLRSTPYINNSNIICTINYGDAILISTGGYSIAYHDGYSWSYGKLMSNNIWGYVATMYLQ